MRHLKLAALFIVYALLTACAQNQGSAPSNGSNDRPIGDRSSVLAGDWKVDSKSCRGQLVGASNEWYGYDLTGRFLLRNTITEDDAKHRCYRFESYDTSGMSLKRFGETKVGVLGNGNIVPRAISNMCWAKTGSKISGEPISQSTSATSKQPFSGTFTQIKYAPFTVDAQLEFTSSQSPFCDGESTDLHLSWSPQGTHQL